MHNKCIETAFNEKITFQSFQNKWFEDCGNVFNQK